MSSVVREVPVRVIIVLDNNRGGTGIYFCAVLYENCATTDARIENSNEDVEKANLRNRSRGRDGKLIKAYRRRGTSESESYDEDEKLVSVPLVDDDDDDFDDSAEHGIVKLYEKDPSPSLCRCHNTDDEFIFSFDEEYSWTRPNEYLGSIKGPGYLPSHLVTNYGHHECFNRD